MSMFFDFVMNYPIIFLIIALGIYTYVAYRILKKKIEKIEKLFNPIRDYIVANLKVIKNVFEQTLANYQGIEEVTNELSRVLTDLNDIDNASTDSLIKLSNMINDFVLNSAIFTLKEHPELASLKEIELFKNTGELKELNERRLVFNELITDYNHDILNPPNSFIVKLFNLKEHYNLLEVNAGKTAKVASSTAIKTTFDNINYENSEGSGSDENKKICPNCKTEFHNSKVCPTCGSIVA